MTLEELMSRQVDIWLEWAGTDNIVKWYIYNYHSLSFHLLHLILVSCNDAACYKRNIRAITCCKIFNSDPNVSHFFSHVHVWNCEAKIFLTYYYYFIHWIHIDHGKPGKLCNLRISFSRPGRSWKVMENLTSVWYRYIKSLYRCHSMKKVLVTRNWIAWMACVLVDTTICVHWTELGKKESPKTRISLKIWKVAAKPKFIENWKNSWKKSGKFMEFKDLERVWTLLNSLTHLSRANVQILGKEI